MSSPFGWEERLVNLSSREPRGLCFWGIEIDGRIEYACALSDGHAGGHRWMDRACQYVETENVVEESNG